MVRNLTFFALALFLVSGCATGRNLQPDLDAMNSRISSLQNQLDAKNREIAALQDENRALMTQAELASRSKADTESRLYQALDKLAGKPSGTSKTAEEGYVK